MKVDSILSQLSGSVDQIGTLINNRDDWYSLFATKAGDQQTALLLPIIAKEGIKDPVVLYSPKGYSGHVWLGNGHHRLVIAMILGIKDVPIQRSSRDYLTWKSERTLVPIRKVTTTQMNQNLKKFRSVWPKFEGMFNV